MLNQKIDMLLSSDAQAHAREEKEGRKDGESFECVLRHR